MRLETFIAGAITGVLLSNTENQRMLKTITQKGIGYAIDNLNKKQVVNSVIQADTQNGQNGTQEE